MKIDDLVLIAHNCQIGEQTLIGGGAIISGSTTIGKNCWIGPNVVIKNKVNVGDHSFVALGSVVLSHLSENQKVLGNPARLI